MCVLSIKVPQRKKSENLSYAPRKMASGKEVALSSEVSLWNGFT